MKKLFIVIVGIMLIGLLVAGCKPRPSLADQPVDTGAANEVDVQDIEQDINSVESIDDEFNYDELDQLDNDTEDII